MEKSRAIELLEHLAWDRDIGRNPYGDALNIAIEALKAQLSCGGTTFDLISRKAVLEIIEDYPHGDWNLETMDDMVNMVRQLPPAQPEDYTELKREFLRMASYIDALLECSDVQKETLNGFISRLAVFIPWTERD